MFDDVTVWDLFVIVICAAMAVWVFFSLQSFLAFLGMFFGGLFAFLGAIIRAAAVPVILGLVFIGLVMTKCSDAFESIHPAERIATTSAVSSFVMRLQFFGAGVVILLVVVVAVVIVANITKG